MMRLMSTEKIIKVGKVAEGKVVFVGDGGVVCRITVTGTDAIMTNESE